MSASVLALCEQSVSGGGVDHHNGALASPHREVMADKGNAAAYGNARRNRAIDR
jgi:hypothetical protein